MSLIRALRLLPAALILTACLPAQTPDASTARATATASRTPRPSATSPPIELSPRMSTELTEIDSQVQTLRGLSPAIPISKSIVAQSTLPDRIADYLERIRPSSDADDEAHWLALLGWAPDDFDWWRFVVDFSTERPMSFYDDLAGELIIAADDPLTPVTRLNYVHEYANALIANAFDLPPEFAPTAETCRQARDRCQAARALIEGDASLVEEQWLRVYASNEEIAELTGFYQAFESPSFTAAPEAVQSSMLFPFEYGVEFVRSFHIDGGWAAVDALYLDPPTSSEMILHPHAYPDDTPRQLTPPDVDADALGAGWREVAVSTLGEHALRLILAQWLPPEMVEQAAQGWYGDQFIAFHHDPTGEGAWAIVHIWDTIRDSQQGFLAWRDYGDQRLGPHLPEGERYSWDAPSGVAILERVSNQTLWLMAPDETVADRLRSRIEFPLGSE